MSKENQTQVPVAKQFAALLGRWALEVNQFQDISDQQKTFNQIKLAYLTTSFADNNQERQNALVIFKEFDEVFALLKGFKPKQFRKLETLTDKWLQDAV